MDIIEVAHIFQFIGKDGVDRQYEDDEGKILCSGVYKDSIGLVWIKDGLFHRDDGPAIIDNNGYYAWFLDGNCVYATDENNISEFVDLSEEIKNSIIQYRLLNE